MWQVIQNIETKSLNLQCCSLIVVWFNVVMMKSSSQYFTVKKKRPTVISCSETQNKTVLRTPPKLTDYNGWVIQTE